MRDDMTIDTRLKNLERELYKNYSVGTGTIRTIEGSREVPFLRLTGHSGAYKQSEIICAVIDGALRLLRDPVVAVPACSNRVSRRQLLKAARETGWDWIEPRSWEARVFEDAEVTRSEDGMKAAVSPVWSTLHDRMKPDEIGRISIGDYLEIDDESYRIVTLSRRAQERVSRDGHALPRKVNYHTLHCVHVDAADGGTVDLSTVVGDLSALGWTEQHRYGDREVDLVLPGELD